MGFAVPEDGGDNKEEELPADESDGHESETTVETDVTADEVEPSASIRLPWHSTTRIVRSCHLPLRGTV